MEIPVAFHNNAIQIKRGLLHPRFRPLDLEKFRVAKIKREQAWLLFGSRACSFLIAGRSFHDRNHYK